MKTLFTIHQAHPGLGHILRFPLPGERIQELCFSIEDTLVSSRETTTAVIREEEKQQESWKFSRISINQRWPLFLRLWSRLPESLRTEAERTLTLELRLYHETRQKLSTCCGEDTAAACALVDMAVVEREKLLEK